MSVSCNGLDFKRFYEDPTFWTPSNYTGEDHTWHEDAVMYVNGEIQAEGIETEKLLDTDRVTIEGGVVFGRVFGSSEPSMEAYFRRWKKKQPTLTLLVECDLSTLALLEAAIKGAGGKIVK